jgi:hypothetical protein
MKHHLSMNDVSQALHVALGALFLFAPVALHWPHPKVVGSIVGLVYAALKEGIYDVYYEDAETRGSGLVDFSFYLLGMGIGLLVLP